MRRRSSAGGEPAKAQRRKTVARKSRVTSKAADPKSSSGAREETRVARLTNELNEARQQLSCDRRRAAGHQSLDVRSGDSAQHAP